MINIVVEIETPNGLKQVQRFIEWEQTQMIFGQDDTFAPYCEFKGVRFFGDAYVEITNSLAKNNYTEPIRCIVYLIDDNNNLTLLNGIIDGETCIFDTDNEILECSIEIDQRNFFSYSVSGKSILKYKGFLKNQVVIKESKDDALASINLLTSIAVLSLEVYKTTKELIKILKDYFAHTTGGISGALAGQIWLGITIALYLAYLGFLIYLIVKLISDIIKLLKGLRKRFEMYRFYDFLENMATQNGLQLVIPSTIKADAKKIWLLKPTPDFYGWVADEYLDLFKKIFNVQIYQYDNKLIVFHMHYSTLQSGSSQFISTPPLLNKFKLNIDDLDGRVLVSQGYDSVDTFSIKAKERFWEYINEGFKGFRKIDIPLPSGLAKTESTRFEKLAVKLLNTFNPLKIFAPSSIWDIYGVQQGEAIRVSDMDFITKLLYFDGDYPKGLGKIFKKYYIYDMAHENQRKKYKTTKIPFNITMFPALVKEQKISGLWVNKLTWKVFSDTANVDFEEEYKYNNSKYVDKII